MPSVQDEIARYRLAMFECAQAAETIGNDMQAKGSAAEFAERCRNLARRLREFAGDGDGSGGPDTGGPSTGGTPAGKVLSIFRKTWSR